MHKRRCSGDCGIDDEKPGLLIPINVRRDINRLHPCLTTHAIGYDLLLAAPHGSKAGANASVARLTTVNRNSFIRNHG